MAPNVSVMPSSLTRPGGAFFLDPAQRVTRAELELRDARWRAMRDRAHAAQRRAQATGRWMGTLSRTASSISRRSGSVWFDEEATLVGSVARYYAARVASASSGGGESNAQLGQPTATRSSIAVERPSHPAGANAFPTVQGPSSSSTAANEGGSGVAARWGLRGRARARLLSSPSTFGGAGSSSGATNLFATSPSLAQSIVEESRARSPGSTSVSGIPRPYHAQHQHRHSSAGLDGLPGASHSTTTNNPSAALLEALQPLDPNSLNGGGQAAGGRRVPKLKNVKKAWRRWKASLA